MSGLKDCFVKYSWFNQKAFSVILCYAGCLNLVSFQCEVETITNCQSHILCASYSGDFRRLF